MRKQRRACELGLPMRPAVPPMLVAAGVVWAAVVCIGQLRLAIGSCDSVAIAAVCFGPTLACLVVAAALHVHDGQKAAVASSPACRAPLLLLVGLSWLLAASSAWVHFALQDECASLGSSAGAGSFVFVVGSDPRQSSYGGCSFKATATGEGRSFDVWVSLSLDDGQSRIPRLGEALELRGSVSALDLDGDFERGKYLQGVAAAVSAFSFVSHGFEASPIGSIRAFRASCLEGLSCDSDCADSLIAGLVFGDQAATSHTSVSDTFSKLGLSHMIAVSGSHLALVATLFGTVLGRARIKPLPRCLVLVALLSIYVCLTGFQISAIRAFAMSFVALAASVFARRSQGLSSLSVAVLVILLVSPGCAYSLGFQLSVASVLGLVVFGRLSESWLSALLPARAPVGLVSTLSITLLAQALTMPLTLPVFGTLPLFSPVANVLLVPVMSVVLLLGLAWCVTASLLPPIAAILLWLARMLSSAVCTASDFLAGLGAVAPVLDLGAFPLWLLGLAGFGALYLFWPKAETSCARRLLAAAASFALLFGLLSLLFPCERMVVLDVGQGDAILLQGGGSNVLVDTGPDDSVVWALSRQGVHRLDALVLTHTDLDHVGGLSSLVGHVEVKSVVLAEGVARELLSNDPNNLLSTIKDDLHAGLSEVLAGDVITAQTFSLRVLWPKSPVAGDENADSLVMYAAWGEDASPRMSALLTGDAECEVLEPLAQAGELPCVDVLKVGHHGSAVSASEPLVRCLGCKVAVASAGKGNRYGHPRDECIQAVQAAGARFICTISAGDVTLSAQGDGLRVSCSGELPLAA